MTIGMRCTPAGTGELHAGGPHGCPKLNTLGTAPTRVVSPRSGEEVSIDAEEVPPLVLKLCEVVEPFGCLVF